MNSSSNDERFAKTRILYFSRNRELETSLEVSNSIRAKCPGSVVVICTDKSREAVRLQNRRCRVFAVVPKTSVEELGNAVRALEKEEYQDNPAEVNFMMAVGGLGGLNGSDVLGALDEQHRCEDGYLRIEFVDAINDLGADFNSCNYAELLVGSGVTPVRVG